jgi:lysine 6-dehydrogenase
MTMRMLVLGGGQQGSACAYDLLTHSDHRVVLADRDVGVLPPFLQPFLGGRLETIRLDASDSAAVRDVVEGASATLSALPYYLNLELARAALEMGSHFCDLGGNTGIVDLQKGLHEAALKKGLSVVPDCGLAPGLVNIVAARGIDRLDVAREVHLKVGGLPQFPEPPLKYQIVYSLEGVIDYYTTPSWILRGGKPQSVEALSEVEEVFFPAIGALEAFHTAGGLSLMARTYEGRVDRMEYKTLRYPGHAEAMRTVRELGLLSEEPVEVGGVQVTPRAVFIAAAGPRLRKDPQLSPDLVALRVDVVGEKDGEEIALCWELIDRFDPRTGITAMMRTTGYSLSITGLLQVEGRIPPGVWTPDEGVPFDDYLRELERRGVRVQETTVD